MPTRKKIIKILQKESPKLKKDFGIKKIALFGSFANNTQRKNSDVDIIVELERPIGLKFFDLAEYLEKALNKKIDILTVDALKAIRIKKVIRSIKQELLYV
ncbi:MAG: nucleotidyltransferase family protein [Candidatus Omnitrophica bacterium]|nr:nucleotidyltransferase family protein [Candidatus Omnitrophota bacterium]